MRIHEARFGSRIGADAVPDDPLGPYDPIRDLDGGTASRLAVGAWRPHDDFLF